MKRGSGIKGRDDRSSGIEIRIAEALAKINPTDPKASILFFLIPGVWAATRRGSKDVLRICRGGAQRNLFVVRRER
jgi:hypothetical protein